MTNMSDAKINQNAGCKRSDKSTLIIFCVFQYLQTFKTLLTSVVQIAAVYPGADALRYLFCNPFLSPVGISPAFAENPP